MGEAFLTRGPVNALKKDIAGILLTRPRRLRGGNASPPRLGHGASEGAAPLPLVYSINYRKGCTALPPQILVGEHSSEGAAGATPKETWANSNASGGNAHEHARSAAFAILCLARSVTFAQVCAEYHFHILPVSGESERCGGGRNSNQQPVLV